MVQQVYSVDQFRLAERALVEAGAGEALMRRAAYGLRTEILRLLMLSQTDHTRRVSGARVTALVGKGNNGGDALWALSFLASRGVHVTALAVGTDEEHLHPAGLKAMLRAGGRVVDTVHPQTDVVVDAVLGIGFHGSFDLPAELQRTGSTVPKTARVVACDIPSGVQGTTGQVPGAVLNAELTVTFGAVKTGLVLGAGAHAAGRISMVDIGLSDELDRVTASQSYRVTALADVAEVFSPPAWDDHKYRRGVLSVAAGSEQYPGAAVLTSAAGLATGLGMVRYAGPPVPAAAVVAAHPEIVAGPEVPGRADAWVLGPGLGDDDAARSRYDAVLADAVTSHRPLVLDASGLDLIETDDLADFAQLAQAGTPVVLTPHAGEMARLINRLLPEVQTSAGESLATADPVSQARTVASQLHCVIVLKGTTTVIAAADTPVYLQPEGGAELATAGSGDTLAGLIGAAVARTHDDVTWRVAAAVRLHAEAGREAAAAGPFGAAHLAAAVRSVLARLHSHCLVAVQQ